MKEKVPRRLEVAETQHLPTTAQTRTIIPTAPTFLDDNLSFYVVVTQDAAEKGSFSAVSRF